MSNNNSLPEITAKAFILGVVLSMVLAAANAYLGLFAGMTVSASIPAAVVSMGLLRLFKKSNILENNIVQTAASAGENDFPGICRAALGVLREEGFRPDYFEIRRASDLADVADEDRDLVILVAARLGKARLIDNVRVDSPR